MPNTSNPDASAGLPRADDWVEQHADMLFRSARRRVGSDHEAQDIVQETLIAGWKSIRDRKDAEPPGAAWLQGILKHKVADHYRRVFRERGIGEPDANLGPATFDDAGHWDDSHYPKKWTEPSVGDERGRIEIREMLDLCLAKLPVAHARVFLLREAEAMDSEEILKLTGLSSSNLFVMLHRARAALRGCLEQNHFAKGASSR